jgi:cell wall assembly regulator SMI1
MTGSRVKLVQEAWNEILAWCQQYAPDTARDFHGPAADAALREAQALTESTWPDQLIEWLRLSDGADGWGNVIPPGFEPLGVEMILEYRAMLRSVAKEVFATDEIDAWEAEEAGSFASGFCRSWVPFAANFGGGFLFVDLRVGARSGCVAEYEHTGGFIRPPIWSDIAAMLDDVRMALRSGRFYRPGYVFRAVTPTVEDRRLGWQDAPADDPP